MLKELLPQSSPQTVQQCMLLVRQRSSNKNLALMLVSGKMSSGEMLREIADLEEQAADISRSKALLHVASWMVFY